MYQLFVVVTKRTGYGEDSSVAVTSQVLKFETRTAAERAYLNLKHISDYEVTELYA